MLLIQFLELTLISAGLLCKKCDLGYYVINHDVMKLIYRLVFIVSISLLHKILNSRQN